MERGERERRGTGREGMGGSVPKLKLGPRTIFLTPALVSEELDGLQCQNMETVNAKI